MDKIFLLDGIDSYKEHCELIVSLDASCDKYNILDLYKLAVEMSNNGVDEKIRKNLFWAYIYITTLNGLKQITIPDVYSEIKSKHLGDDKYMRMDKIQDEVRKCFLKYALSLSATCDIRQFVFYLKMIQIFVPKYLDDELVCVKCKQMMQDPEYGKMNESFAWDHAAIDLQTIAEWNQ